MAKAGCSLIPIDLSQDEQRTRFQEQRVLCGWDYSPDVIQGLQNSCKLGTKTLFWIMIPDDELPIGHISLNSEVSPPDPELADPINRTIMTISTFFILDKYRSKGYGGAAMYEAEKLAINEPFGSPDCHTITITTFAGKFSLSGVQDTAVYDYWAEPRIAHKEQERNLGWYQRMGYQMWKEGPRWPHNLTDGTPIICYAAHLRKHLTNSIKSNPP